MMNIIWNYFAVVGALMLIAAGCVGLLVLIARGAKYDAEAAIARAKMKGMTEAVTHTTSDKYSDAQLARALVMLMHAVREDLDKWKDGFDKPPRPLSDGCKAAQEALKKLTDDATPEEAIAVLVAASDRVNGRV